MCSNRKDERERLVRLYFDRFILEVADKRGSRLKLGEFDYSTVCSEIATVCDGMSGREIAKLASAWQVSAKYSGIVTTRAVFTPCK